jgi:Bacterial archaeo-eukaryotic release factor family 3
MHTQDIAVEPLVSLEQLKTMVESAGPCVSIYSSSFSVGNSPSLFITHLQAALLAAERQLESQRPDGSPLDLPFSSICDIVMREYQDRHRGSFAIFLSRDTARIVWAACPLDELMRIDDVFYIRPLISALAIVREFYVLALSQKHVRFLKCTNSEAHVVELPGISPQSVDEAMAMDAPDHRLENSSSAGSGDGAMGRIRFSTGTADKKSDSYILRFFAILNEEINRLMRYEQIPLVLCAVERELALYQKINTYPRLVGEGIHGSPDWLSDAQLQEQALLVLERERTAAEEKAVSQFSEKTVGALLENDPELILAAAGAGNVRAVLLAEQPGDTENGDLLNLLAVQAIRKGGQVLTTSANSLPGGKTAIAILRHRP